MMLVMSRVLLLFLVVTKTTYGWSIWPTDPFASDTEEAKYSSHVSSSPPSSSQNYHNVSYTTTFIIDSGRGSWRDTEKLQVFCHEAEPKSVFSFWTTIKMDISKKYLPGSQQITVFYGVNESSVRKEYEEYNKRLVKLSFWGSSDESYSFPVFTTSCVGISFKGNLVLEVVRYNLSLLKFTLTVLGVVLFFLSPKLSKNSLLYYSSSVTTGILASILILVYVLHRFLPKNLASFALVMGSSVTLVVYKMLWSHFHSLIQDYSTFISCYVILSALVSFAVSYYFGPPSSPRAHSLIQWFIQLVSLVMIALSSDHTEGVSFIVIAILTAYNMPYKLLGIYVSWARSFWQNTQNNLCQPLLLSEEEYTLQGDIETEKALKELREHCRSPHSNAWRIVSSVKDPVKFAKFVEGDPHVSDDEVSFYEESFRSKTFSELKFDDENTRDMLTDDEDEELEGIIFDESDEENKDEDDNHSITPSNGKNKAFPSSIRKLSPILKTTNNRGRNYSGSSSSTNGSIRRRNRI